MWQLIFDYESGLAVDNGGFLVNPFFIQLVYSVIGLAILIIGLIILKRFIQRRLAVALGKKVILAVTLPKEAAVKAGETVKPLTEQIAAVETLFSTLGGLKPKAGWRSWFRGRTDQLALEIVAKGGLIYFYVAPPAGLERYVEEQIHAQYPQANIEVVTDYNIFQPRSAIVAGELKFVKPYIFPIRTYQDLGSDPLNSLTNSLSKLTKDDGAVIQFIVRSAKPGWHQRGKKVASQMQQGKSAKEVLSEAAPVKKFIHNWSEALKNKPQKDVQPPAVGYHLSPMEGEIIKGLEQKAAKAGFDVNIRLVVSAPSLALAKSYLENIVNSFAQFNIYEFGNGFAPAKKQSLNRLIHSFIYRSFNEKNRLLLNTEELASVFHFPLPTTETPNIVWLTAKRAAAPVNLPHEGVCLGRNLYRGAETLINLKKDDRRRHLYIIGKSGTGKSVLLANLAIQDIAQGQGVCVIDPHGDLIENILARAPSQRAGDIIVFNPADTERPMGLNMLEAKLPGQTDFVVQEMIQIFYKLLPDPAMAGPMFEHYMRNALLLLIADKENLGTLVELPRVFTDKEFRQKKLEKVTDILVKDFWEREYEQSQKGSAAADMLSYVISKTGRFIENEMMRNIIGQPYSGFDFREIMDQQKVLLVNLSKGQTGEINSNLLGLIIVSKLQMAAMGRADLPEDQRNDFYLYLDEFQNFITASIATILSEARKYRLNLVLAHQYLGQLVEGTSTQIRDAVLGTVGTMVAFKVGVEDAEVLAKEFAPVFDHYDLINIEKFNAYVKLLVDNQAARAFNLETYPLSPGNQQLAYAIKDSSRLKYGRPKKIVEAEIIERSQLGQMENLTK